MFAKRLSVAGKIISLLMAASILLSVSACSGTETTVTPIVQPSITPILIPTIIPPTSTPTDVLTASIDNQSCWDVKPLTEAGTRIPGSLLYSDSATGKNSYYDLSNYKTKIAKTRPIISNLVYISPDGSSIVTIDYDKNFLRLDFQNQYRNYPIPENAYFGGFISNNQIWLGESRADLNNYIPGVGTTDKYYILSLSTGTLTSYSVELPGFWTNVPATTRIESYVQYSPDLNYAMYSAETSEGENVLLNLKTSKVIWSGASSFGFPSLPLPIWNPDSTEVIIVQSGDTPNNEQNFFRISLDGTLSQITHLEKTFNDSYDLENPSWSPNGRYLAFVAVQNSNLTLFILDLQTNTLLNTCISEDSKESMRIWFPLIWSSDGNQLALTSGGKAKWVWIDPSTDKAKLVQDVAPDLLIADLVHHEIYKLPVTTNSLLGWLSWEIP